MTDVPTHSNLVPPTADSVALYHINLAQFEPKLEALWSILTQDERDYVNRLCFAADRLRHVSAFGTLRLLLAQILRCNPADLCYDQFSSSQFNVAATCSAARQLPLHCSYAFEGKRAIVAISTNFAIGVDIKQIASVPEESAIIKRYFSQREQALLNQFTQEMRTAMFFQYLSRKSALYKANDVLKMPTLEYLDVAPIEHGLAATYRPHPVQDGWKLVSLQVNSGHTAAIAINPATGTLQQTTVTVDTLFRPESESRMFATTVAAPVS